MCYSLVVGTSERIEKMTDKFDWDDYEDPIDPSEICGRRIAEVVVICGGYRFESECIAPDEEHSNTFDLSCEFVESLGVSEPKRKSKTFLVLDNYGNDMIPNRLENRIINETPYTIAIDRDSGVIHTIIFRPIKMQTDDLRSVSSNMVAAFIFGFPADEEEYGVPTEYLGKLDELKHQTRPFRIDVDSFCLMEFCEREKSYDDLQQSVIVDLRFNKKTLNICPEWWRETSVWKPPTTWTNVYLKDYRNG